MSCSTAECHCYPSVLAPRCHTSPMLDTVQDCKKTCLRVDLAIGLLRKLTAVDLAETEQQDKASRAPKPDKGRLWTKRGRRWTGFYSTSWGKFTERPLRHKNQSGFEHFKG